MNNLNKLTKYFFGLGMDPCFKLLAGYIMILAAIGLTGSAYQIQTTSTAVKFNHGNS